MIRVGIIGVPASGKTTAVHDFHKFLVEKGVHSLIVPESARLFIRTHNRVPTAEDQYTISKNQVELEEMQANWKPEVLLCEQVPFIPTAYVKTYNPDATEVLEYLLQYKDRSYDLIFKTQPLPYKEDGVRYQSEEEWEELSERIDTIADLYDYVLLPSSREERVEVMWNEVKKMLDDEERS